MKGMVYRHKLAEIEERWVISSIDRKYKPVVDIEHNVKITVTTTSVIFKDGAKILKKKAAKKGDK
jgi:hypothetical protein